MLIKKKPQIYAAPAVKGLMVKVWFSSNSPHTYYYIDDNDTLYLIFKQYIVIVLDSDV